MRGALLLAGDTEGYERVCARLLDRGDKLKCFDVPGERATCSPGSACCRLPQGDDPARLARLGNEAVKAEPNAWHLHTLGLAHYRAGRYEEAVRELQQSMRVDPKWPAVPVNWLVLAMAHHRLGHAKQARQWLDKAVDAIDKDRMATSGKANIKTWHASA